MFKFYCPDVTEKPQSTAENSGNLGGTWPRRFLLSEDITLAKAGAEPDSEYTELSHCKHSYSFRKKPLSLTYSCKLYKLTRLLLLLFLLIICMN